MRWHCPLLVAALAAVSAAEAASQAPTAPRTPFCLEERGPDACSLTVLLSPAIHAIAGTSGESQFETSGPDGVTRFEHFKPFQYTLSLAVLRDVGSRNAAGGFLQLGLANKQQIRVAAGGRYRWRRGERVAIDVSPGVVHMQMPGEAAHAWTDHEPRLGFTGDVDLHLDHWAILTTRLDVIPTRTGTAVGVGGGLKVDGSPGNRSVLLLIGGAFVALALWALYVNAES